MTVPANALVLSATADAVATAKIPGDTAPGGIGRAGTLLDARRCEAAHAYALVRLAGRRRLRPPTQADPRLLPDVLALFALCDRRTAALGVLCQYTDLLPAWGVPGRDGAVAVVIDAVSNPRRHAGHRPVCQYRTQRNCLRWDQVRARIRQPECSAHPPQQSAGQAQPTASVGASNG